MWNNVAIQSGRSFIRSFKENPGRFIRSVTALLTAGLGLAMYNSRTPEARSRYWDEMTPEQRAATIPLMGGDGKIFAEITLPQELRAPWAALLEATGALTGYKAGQLAGDTPLDDVQRAFGNMFDWGMTEAELQDIGAGAGAGFMSSLPTPSTPITDLALAVGGVDPRSMQNIGRFTSETNAARLIREENITAANYGRVPGDFMSNQWQLAIQSIIGAAMNPFWDASNAFHRSLENGYTLDQAIDSSLDNFAGQAKDRGTAVGSELWGWEKRTWASDSVSKIVAKKLKDIDQIQAFGGQEKRQGRSSIRPSVGNSPETFYVPQTIQGTKLA